MTREAVDMTVVPTWQRIRRAGPRLSTAAVKRMEALPWFAGLTAEQRSYVGMVVQTGLAAFVAWYRKPGWPPVGEPTGIFSAAPRELARSVTLQQTVQLIRAAMEVLEEAVPSLAAPGDEAGLAEAVLRYSREIAFAAADIYAAAAEERGAWDARLEASVVEALVRGEPGEETLTRAAALGWGRPDWVTAFAGRPPVPATGNRVSDLRVAARHSAHHLLAGESAGRLLLVVGGADPADRVHALVTSAFGPGPVVVGPFCRDLGEAGQVVSEALAGLAAAPAWPDAPRPVAAADLLAERAVLGDPVAHRRLLAEVHSPLAAATGDLLLTAATYLDGGGSVEGTARLLFLHPNTVRYRLRKVADTIGYDVLSPRDAQVVRLALVLGRARTPL